MLQKLSFVYYLLEENMILYQIKIDYIVTCIRNVKSHGKGVFLIIIMKLQ